MITTLHKRARRNRGGRGPISIVALALVSTLVFVAFAGLAFARTQAPPANTAPPTITGTPTVGQTLTANNGTWTNSPTAFQYQWRRCNAAGAACANIAGAIERTYTLGAADAGDTIRVAVTAFNADGAATATSAQTAVVGPSAAPRNTERPSISGEPEEGSTLTAEEGNWTGNPTSFAYQWEQCDLDSANCANIAGATGKTYVARAADVGTRLRVEVTATNAQGRGVATSATSPIILPRITITNARPTVRMVSVRFLGARVYARFRICDDRPTNLTILATDSRPGRASFTRRFSTRIPPRPCGVYTRNWVPAARFRGPGRYTVTIRARDTSRRTSAPASRSFRLR